MLLSRSRVQLLKREDEDATMTPVAEVGYASAASCPLWKHDVEVLDRGGDEDDTVGIALLVDSSEEARR